MPTSRPEVLIQRAILNCFADVAGFDAHFSFKIPKRSPNVSVTPLLNLKGSTGWPGVQVMLLMYLVGHLLLIPNLKASY